MRVRGLLAGVIVAGLTTSFTFAADSPATVVPEGITFPVVLKKTIDTAKARPGDVVKFELLSPVVVNHTVVIPENAKVYGKIVEAHPLAKNPFSSLAIVVESIAWRHQTVPLHAHLIGFGKLRVTYFGEKAKCNQNLAEIAQPVRTAERVRGEPPVSGTSAVAGVKTVFSDTQCDQVIARSETDSQRISYIRMAHTTSDLVPLAFLSTKRDIVIKKGALLVIRNGADLATMGGTSAKNKMPHP